MAFSQNMAFVSFNKGQPGEFDDLVAGTVE
jgi:hypothetical protein